MRLEGVGGIFLILIVVQRTIHCSLWTLLLFLHLIHIKDLLLFIIFTVLYHLLG